MRKIVFPLEKFFLGKCFLLLIELTLMLLKGHHEAVCLFSFFCSEKYRLQEFIALIFTFHFSISLLIIDACFQGLAVQSLERSVLINCVELYHDKETVLLSAV